jgi:hypothetical protein
MLYQLSYASLLETPNLSLSLPETSRHTGQSSKDTTAELRVQAEATHFRIPVLERKCALYVPSRFYPKRGASATLTLNAAELFSCLHRVRVDGALFHTR